jgi:polysaccharide biosynthesis protein PelA
MKPQIRAISSILLSAAILAGLTGPVSAQTPVSSGSLIKTSAQQTDAAKRSLTGVQSYTIYYGAPTANALRKLAAYDMVVVEPRLWSEAQVQTLQKNGTKVIGYLSVLEQYKSSPLLADSEDADYLKVNGKRDWRSEWKSWSMDISSAHYRSLLVRDLEAQIVAKGLNGVFLDTVGNVDDGIWSDAISNRQRDGVVSFVSALRAAYPTLSLIQNWGLTLLKDRTAPYIDGLLWEDFDPREVSGDAWSKNRMRELDALEAKGLSVFTVKLGRTPKAQRTTFDKLNASHGYVGQLITRSYDEL